LYNVIGTYDWSIPLEIASSFTHVGMHRLFGQQIWKRRKFENIFSNYLYAAFVLFLRTEYLFMRNQTLWVSGYRCQEYFSLYVVTYWQHIKILNKSFISERGVFYFSYQFPVHWALFKEMYKILIPVAYKLKTVLGRYEPEK